eukprot:8683041-Pyramimonas_sp.AAC.1
MWLSSRRRSHSLNTVQEDCQGVEFTLIRGTEVPGMAFWHDSGWSRHNSQVYSWRWNPENGVLARFKMFTRLSPNGALPSEE